MKLLYLIIIKILIVSTVNFAQYTNVAIATNSSDQSEITIAISPLSTNYLKVSWNEFRSGTFSEPGFAFSTNNGITWNEGITPDIGNYIYGFDPSSAFDKFGNAFYCYIAAPNNYSNLGPVFVSRTTTFSPPFVWNNHAQVSNSSSLQDKPYLAIDNTGSPFDGRVYVSWTDFTVGSKIKFSYSTDHGSSFSPEIVLGTAFQEIDPDMLTKPVSETSLNNGSFVSVQGSMPSVGPNGELYVAWMFINSGIYNGSFFHIRKSTDGGVSFAPDITVPHPFTWDRQFWGSLDHFNLPSLAVDFSNSYVYLVYKDRISQTNSTPRIRFIRSTDGGNSWSTPNIISDLGEKGEVFPWIAVDGYGKIAVSFMHRHNDNTVDCYVVESYDHGTTFRSPIRVSNQSSNPANSTWTHHYMGMVLDNLGNNYIVWTDYRNGNADPYFAKVNTPPDAPQNLAVTASQNNHPLLTWDTNQETDLSKYRIYKKKGSGSWDLIDSTSSTTYEDVVENVVGKYPQANSITVYYKITAVDLSANESAYSNTASIIVEGPPQFKISSHSEPLADIPQSLQLFQNYPNPFNPSTNITFYLPEAAEVEVSIYTLTGEKVITLLNKYNNSGTYQLHWDGKDANGKPIGSGIYLYQLKAGKKHVNKKMMLIK